MESGLTEYVDFLKEGLADTGPLVARPYYDHESDTLYFYGRDVPSFARRLNSLLTVVLANDNIPPTNHQPLITNQPCGRAGGCATALTPSPLPKEREFMAEFTKMLWSIDLAATGCGGPNDFTQRARDCLQVAQRAMHECLQQHGKPERP